MTVIIIKIHIITNCHYFVYSLNVGLFSSASGKLTDPWVVASGGELSDMKIMKLLLIKKNDYKNSNYLPGLSLTLPSCCR